VRFFALGRSSLQTGAGALFDTMNRKPLSKRLRFEVYDAEKVRIICSKVTNIYALDKEVAG